MVPPIRKAWGAAPRDDVELAIRPDLDYAVVKFYNDGEEATNGIIQAFTIDLPHGSRVTCGYVSRKTSAGAFNNIISDVRTNDTGRDWLVA